MRTPGTVLADPPESVAGAAADAAALETPAALARRALRRVASGVTVLTVDDAGLRHGTTVSAAITVSREPLVLGLCLNIGSTFAEMVRRRERFSVNVLAAAQEAVARHFADPARPIGDAQFAGLPWWTDAHTGAPLLGGAVAHLSCRALSLRRVGDHDLLLAEVVAGRPAGGEPLLSYAGRLLPAPDTETAPRARTAAAGDDRDDVPREGEGR